MSYAYRCSKTGLVDWTDAPGRARCVYCGKLHTTFQTGLDRREGFPNTQQPFKPHDSFIFGRRLESWSDVWKAEKEKGLINTGEPPPYKTHLGKVQVRVP